MFFCIITLCKHFPLMVLEKFVLLLQADTNITWKMGGLIHLEPVWTIIYLYLLHNICWAINVEQWLIYCTRFRHLFTQEKTFHSAKLHFLSIKTVARNIHFFSPLTKYLQSGIYLKKGISMYAKILIFQDKNLTSWSISKLPL